MIAVCGSRIAHLGGPRGDRLSLSLGGAPFVPAADLGFDETRQCGPQRRLLLTEEALFVLEPASGLVLEPPLRVRRFDPSDGRELAGAEGPGEEGEAGLVFHASILDAATMRIRRYGVDPATGRPLRWEGSIARHGLLRREEVCHGVPLLLGATAWYPFRVEGLLRIGPPGDACFPADVAAPAHLLGRVVVPAVRRGRSGLFLDGRFHPFPRGTPRLFPAYRSPLGGAVAAQGAGFVALLVEGGRLPSLFTPSPRLFPGHYSALAAIPEGLFAVEERPWPRLVPAAFDSGAERE